MFAGEGKADAGKKEKDRVLFLFSDCPAARTEQVDGNDG